MLTCCDGPLICIITGSFTKSQPSRYLGLHSLQHSSPYKPLPSPGCYVLSKTNKQNKTAEYYTDDFSEQMTLMDKETDRQIREGHSSWKDAAGTEFFPRPCTLPFDLNKENDKVDFACDMRHRRRCSRGSRQRPGVPPELDRDSLQHCPQRGDRGR